MNKNEILEKVTEICRDVFEDEKLVITEGTCAADVEKWDSLTHLNMISDLEDEFGISFTLDEVMSSRNMGELLNALIRHLEKQGV